MSHNPNYYDSDEEEQFVDFEHPEGMNIIEDDGQPPPTDDESSSVAPNDFGDENDNEDDADVVCRGVHTKPVHCVAVHPTMRHFIATGGEDDNVVLWDLSGVPKATSTVLSGHADTVLAVAFQPTTTPSLSLLASASMDSTVKLWDLTKTPPVAAGTLSDLGGEVLWLMWHSSGVFVVAGCADGRAAMWSVESKQVIQFFCCGDTVNVGIWTADEKRLVLGSNDCMVRVFSPKTGEGLVCPTGKVSATALSSVHLHPDAIVAGLEDGNIVIISVAQHKIMQELPDVHDQAIENIAMHPTLALMGCVSCDCVVSMWNCQNYSLRYLVRHDDGITRGLWLDTTFVAGTLNGAVLAWDGREEFDEENAKVLHGHRAAILDVAQLTPNAVVTTSDDATVRVFTVIEHTSIPQA
eukprot:PhM_4_TR16363/c0_g1_i1/m.33268